MYNALLLWGLAGVGRYLLAKYEPETLLMYAEQFGVRDFDPWEAVIWQEDEAAFSKQSFKNSKGRDVIVIVPMNWLFDFNEFNNFQAAANAFGYTITHTYFESNLDQAICNIKKAWQNSDSSYYNKRYNLLIEVAPYYQSKLASIFGDAMELNLIKGRIRDGEC